MKNSLRLFALPLVTAAIVSCGFLAVAGPASAAGTADDDKAFHDPHHGDGSITTEPKPAVKSTTTTRIITRRTDRGRIAARPVRKGPY